MPVPIRSPVRERTGSSKSRDLRASVPFFPLLHPAPSTFLLSPHISRGPNAKTSFARPGFRSRGWGTLATQANADLFACLVGFAFLGDEF